MAKSGKITIILTNKSLFLTKLTTVFVATLVLVPLVYYKLYVPAEVYIVTLIVIHLVFLYTYLTKISWTRLARDRVGLGLRILAVLFLSYLLAVLKFEGEFMLVMANLAAGLMIHTMILLALMAEVSTKQLER